jgi:outer membrane protein
MFMDTMKTLLLALLICASYAAQANTGLGVFGSMSQKPYKAIDTQYNLFPNITYQGERFYLRFPEIGYRLLPRPSFQSLAIGLTYDSSGLDPKDSSDKNIRQLDKRDDSVMAFVSYRLGPITAKLVQDISGEHDGYYSQLSAGYPVSFHSWRVIPSISYRHIGSKMSNHLFGVSQSESDTTSGAIETYRTNTTSFVRYGVIGIYPIMKNANIMIGINHTRFDDEIFASPIIEDNQTTSLISSFMLSF